MEGLANFRCAVGGSGDLIHNPHSGHIRAPFQDETKDSRAHHGSELVFLLMTGQSETMKNQDFIHNKLV